jgi:hypothetical protein
MRCAKPRFTTRGYLTLFLSLAQPQSTAPDRSNFMLTYRSTNLAVACVLAVFGVGCHAAKNKPIIDPVLSEMFGKDRESEEVKRFVREMGMREPDGRSGSWNSNGIRVLFGEDGKVGTIVLDVRPHGPKASIYYKGRLPGGVDRDDDRQKVESKIGKADFYEDFGGQTIDCYESTGLRIRYDGNGPRPASGSAHGASGRMIEMIIVRPADLRKK